MKDSKLSTARPSVTKHVLQAEWRTREHCAWNLLHAIEALYPDQIKTLRAITDGSDLEVLQELRRLPFLDETRIISKVESRVQAWTASNSVGCPAVDEAATCLALGASGPRTGPINGTVDDDGRQVEPDSLTAYPYDETKEEFLGRAGDYFDEVVRFYGPDVTAKRAKRDDPSHFLYLAAHLVGGHTWKQIANGETPFNLAVGSLEAVAGEARKLARLIGIPPAPSGRPRKGSRPTPPLKTLR